MESRIPEHHPLRQLFGTLAEKAFTEKLGWADFNVSEYVSKLLVDFTHTDQLNRIKNARGERVEALVELLYESEVTHEAGSFEREREVHRHIGDFTLFWTGVYPEHLRPRAGRVSRLEVYLQEGKRSYSVASELTREHERPPAEVLQQLSEQFEYCVHGLRLVRASWEEMANRPGHN